MSQINTDLISVYKSSAPPFPTAVMAGSYNIPLVDFMGENVSYKTLFCSFKNGQGEWWASRKEVDEIAKATIKAISKDPTLIDNAKDRFVKLVNELLKILDKRMLEKNLPTMKLSEMSGLFKKALEIYQPTTYWLEPANFALEVGGHQIVHQMFTDYLNSQGKYFSGSQISEIFAILSNSPKISFVAKAELSLLNIALIQNNELKHKAAEEHIQKYYWLGYDYYGPLLTREVVEKELESYKKISAEEIEERIQELENFEQTAEKKLQEILESIPLSKELDNIFLGLRKFAYYYGDLKKMEISKANVGLGQILKELSSRLGVDETDLHYATTSELEALLDGEKIDLNIFSQRRQKSLLQVNDTVYKFVDFPLPLNNELVEQGFSGILKGMSACSGLYLGKAKIVSDPRNTNFKEGDVLVTEMTSVDFVPLMKKAGAIVTNRGGITSHAAIVSRELNVPCVIGTENATQVIKDGDTVQVNARHGIIKILKGE